MGAGSVGDSGRVEPPADDPGAVARAETEHWRALAERREAALHALSRRPLVRLAVGVERRLTPRLRPVRSGARRLRAAVDQATVALAGLARRPARRRRRTDLDREVARLEPVPPAPPVSVLTLRELVDDHWMAAAGTAVTVIAPADGSEGPASSGAVAAALAEGANTANDEILCFVPTPLQGVTPGWLARLAAVVGGDVVAATPTLVHPARPGRHATEHDLLVRAEGFDLERAPSGTPAAVARRAGEPVAVQRAPVEVDAAPLAGLVVARSAYGAVGGLEPADDLDVAAVDLCTRLRRQGGRIVHVPAALVVDDRPVRARSSLRRPIEPEAAAWRWFVERHGAASAGPPPSGEAVGARWVITTSAPSAKVALRWGDWHVAEGLSRGLRRLGQDVEVQTHDRADSLVARSADVHLVVRGLSAVRRTPGQHHVLWVISHPEHVTMEECDEADLVLVASPRFAEHLRGRTSTPVEVLLQATDADRFRPRPTEPQHEHPVTVVAKTRDVRRRVVIDALAAGIRPAIYGGGWQELVDPSLVVANHVDNEVLPVVYSSAGVVLNDHWDTMRAWGFVSNRIFDVLACGAPVISDDLPELRDLFGEAVPTYRTSDELGRLVRQALEDPVQARALAAAGRAEVLAHHTFDQRAAQLLELLEQHGLHRGPR